MADPKKEQIADRFVTVLKTITTGGGYHTNAGDHVSRRRQHILEPDGSRLPCLYLFTGSEDEVVETLGGTVRCFSSNAEFVVTGYVESQNPDEDLVKLEADVKQAVLSDATLTGQSGGLVGRIAFLGSSTDYAEFAPQGRGMVAVAFDVTYQWTAAAP